MSVAAYMDMLNDLSRQFEGQESQQHQRHYYSEFYDDSPEQYSYGEGQLASESHSQGGERSSSSYEALPGGATEYDSSTVGTTATYLSTLSVRLEVHLLSSLKIDELVLEIPFAEQDDPPNDDDTIAASLESDNGNERMDGS